MTDDGSDPASPYGPPRRETLGACGECGHAEVIENDTADIEG